MDCRPKTLDEACDRIRNCIGRDTETVKLIVGVADAKAAYRLAMWQVHGDTVCDGDWDGRVEHAEAMLRESESCWRDCDTKGVHDALTLVRHEYLVAASLVRRSIADAVLKKEPDNGL